MKKVKNILLMLSIVTATSLFATQYYVVGEVFTQSW